MPLGAIGLPSARDADRRRRSDARDVPHGERATEPASLLTAEAPDERVAMPDRDSGSQGRKTKRVAVRVGRFCTVR